MPLVRSRTARQQHKFTVVRRRPLVPYTREEYFSSSTTPRRLVVTRIRTLGPVDSSPLPSETWSSESVAPDYSQHKLTITRRRKLQPTTTNAYARARVTRKKLVSVRPLNVEPTPTFAIITTGFFTATTEEDYYDDYSSIQFERPEDKSSESTPKLNETPNNIDSRPEVQNVPNDKTTSSIKPIIITDNFFLPESQEEADSESQDKLAASSKDAKQDTINTMKDSVKETTLGGANYATEVSVISTKKLEDSSKPLNSTSTDKNELNLTNAHSTTTENTPKRLLQNSKNFTAEKSVVDDEISSVLPLDYTEAVTDGVNSVIGLKSTSTIDSYESSTLSNVNEEIPSIIPLDAEMSSSPAIISSKSNDESIKTISLASPTPEDIEGGLADDLFLSLSRPDFPSIILPSKPISEGETKVSHDATPELSTSIYYTETIVTSTRLRTYTYVVTKLNGLETEVTSSTTVRPRVTTLTLTVPVSVTITPTKELSTITDAPVYSPESKSGE